MLRLSGPLAVLLVAEHPSSDVRRAVHGVVLQAQARAWLSLLDVLRPLRDDIAECYGQPSYAHMRLDGSVAGALAERGHGV